MKYFKLARLDGYDFYTGKTINYRENIGKWVQVPRYKPRKQYELCSDQVIHASQNINDCFIGVTIPCSAYIVKGRPIIKGKKKCGFKRLFIIREIPHKDFNESFGWNILEAENPIHPFKIKPPKITSKHIKLLQKWASVWASVGASVWASVRDSVRDSVWASVWASVGASVRDSVGDSVGAYIGSLFPNIKKWKYIEHEEGVYPFQCGSDLWRQGLVASFDGKKWRLHGGEKAEILYEEST